MNEDRGTNFGEKNPKRYFYGKFIIYCDYKMGGLIIDTRH